MALYLDDLAARRLGELARILAGCALTEPADVIAMVEKLDQRHITDGRARAFLAILRTQFTPGDDDLRQVAELAFNNGYTRDFYQWLSLATMEPVPADELARRTIREIQSIIIARGVIENLQAMGREIEFLHGWGNHATRQRRIS